MMNHAPILEAATLHITPGLEKDFEAAFKNASSLISRLPGYIQHELYHCIETPHQYLLLVHWEKMEDHTIGFRNSPEYQEWKALLHHFYSPFPIVEHFAQVRLSD